MNDYKLIGYENMEKLGYLWDADGDTYFKELFFDYNDMNKRRGLATIFFMDNKLEIFKGKLYHLCENADEVIKKEIDKLLKSNIIKEQ